MNTLFGIYKRRSQRFVRGSLHQIQDAVHIGLRRAVLITQRLLNRRMVQDLKLWIADRKGQLFPDFEIKRTSKMIKRDLVAAGLPVRTESGTRCFHSLRNTYISSLFDAGRNIAQVQRLARHSDPRLTMKYAKPRSDEWALVDDLNYPGHDP